VRLVLDADVLIGALDGSDPHHAHARRLFSSWHSEGAERLVSVINLSEVLVAPATHPRSLRTAREAIAALGVMIHQPGEAIGIDAARLRGAHPVSLPDAYCLATARHTRSVVMSFDRRLIRTARAEGIAVDRDGGQ